MEITVTVNGTDYTQDVEPRTLLVDFIRSHAGLTGTHVGCDTSQCGACTILMNGQAVKACTVFTVQAEGAKITTIEGLAKNGELHPIQQGFWEKHGLQCGFCTPGMITTAHALLSEEPDADADRVREVLSGNLCRCTGYISIVEAVLDARPAYRKRGEGTPI